MVVATSAWPSKGLQSAQGGWPLHRHTLTRQRLRDDFDEH
jgi:hypothetical protein